MKKYLKFIPHVVFAAILIFMGAYGKLAGADMATGLFTKLGLFGQPEYIGRYLVGLAELAAGLGVFFVATRKYAALLGIIVMVGALYFQAIMLGYEMLPVTLLTIAAGIWIFVKTKHFHDHSKCANGTCPVK